MNCDAAKTDLGKLGGDLELLTGVQGGGAGGGFELNVPFGDEINKKKNQGKGKGKGKGSKKNKNNNNKNNNNSWNGINSDPTVIDPPPESYMGWAQNNLLPLWKGFLSTGTWALFERGAAQLITAEDR